MKIAVIGAGLNGLAFAALLRRLGLDCTVFERGEGPRDAGSGIYVWPQGVQVLRFLFGNRNFMAQGQAVEYLDTHDHHGRLLHSQPVRLPGFDFPAPAMMFHRPRLFALLREQLAKDTVQLGMALERITPADPAWPDGPVDVHFTHGQRQRFDLVVGTDGLHSAVRRHVNPGQVPRDTGLVASRGIVHFDHDTFHNERSQIFTTRFARVVTYCMQGRESLRYWFAAYQHQGRPPHDRDSLLELFADLPEPVRAMMASTPQEAILTHAMHALSGTGPWHRGRAVLLGDSAHAMLPTMGYGLTLGLENGFMLAQALAGHCDEDLTTALRRYETRAARRSQAMIDVMQAMTDLYYFEPEGTVSGTRIEPIIGRFRDLTATTVF